MLGARIPSGAVYDGSTRRRQPVEFSQPVRNEVEHLVLRMHQLRRDGCTPQARRMPACRNCSMAERCLPELLDGTQSVAAYMQRMTRTSAE